MAGRPTKLDAKTIKLLCAAIKVGATYPVACKCANISYETFCEWRRRAEDEETGIYADFVEAIGKADAINLMTALRAIANAAREGDAKWGAWMLERRYPEEYGRTISEQRHSGSITLLTPSQLEELSDDELRAYRLRLSAGAS